MASKIESYAVFHLAALVADVKTMSTAFDNEQFTTVGTDACQVAQAIFTSTDLFDANTNVCDLLTGIWTQAGLTSPTAICACFDPTTAQNILTLVGQVLTEASSGSITVIAKIIS